MKIVCDSCATKYSISDDKVRGKVFKIRCKKCSHIIVVRGNNESAAAAAGHAPAATSEGGWHLVVDGDQVGPLSDADVRGRLSRGEINAESFIWKDGFADWVKLSTVEEFAADLPAPADSTIVGDSGGHLLPESHRAEPSGPVMVAASTANSGGLFGSISVTSEESEASNGADAGLGGSFGSSPSPSPAPVGGGDLFAAQAAPRAADESRRSNSGGAAAAAASHDGGRIESLTAQRHENSVLFSLSNLQSLASPGGAAKPAPSSSSGSPATGSEGSGLIDIRAMAATTLGSPSDSRGGGNGGDDLPSFGAFSPAAPVLLSLPTPSGPPKWIYPAIAVMLGLLGVIAWMTMKILSDKPGAVVEAPVAPVAAPIAATAAKPAEPVAAAAPTTPSAPAIPDEKLPPREPAAKPPEAAAAAPAAKPERTGKRGKGGRRGVVAESGGGGSRASAPAAAAPAPTPSEPVGARPAKGSLDELLEGAISSKPARAASKPREEDRRPAAEPPSAGPLSKNAIVAGMNGIKGKISDCYNQYKVPGMVMVNIVIGRSGKVSSATSTGKFAGTPTGACVEKAVKTASFPPSDGLTTPYPIVLK